MGIAFFFFLVLAFSRFFVVNLKFCLLPETDRNVWGLFLRLSTFVKTYFFSRCFVVLCRCPHWNLEEALVCVHAFCILAYFWRREYSFTGLSVLSCLTVALLQSSPSPSPFVFSSKDIVGILLCSSERVREIGCYWDPRTVICKFTRPDPTAVMRFVLGCKRGNWKQYPVYCVLQHTLMHCCLFALLRTCVAYLMCRRNTTANTTYEVLFGNKSGWGGLCPKLDYCATFFISLCKYFFPLLSFSSHGRVLVVFMNFLLR